MGIVSEGMLQEIRDLLRDQAEDRAPAIGLLPFTIPLVVFARPANTTAYTANDIWTDAATRAGGYLLNGAARKLGGSGYFTDAIISTSASTALQGELWIFNSPVTNVADNAAFAISDAEAQALVGIIPFNCTDTATNNAISYVSGLQTVYTCNANSADLWFLVKVMNAPTPGSAEVLSVLVKVMN